MNPEPEHPVEASPESVLGFWFGKGVDDAVTADEKSALWWGKSDKTDQLIRTQFALLRDAAIGEELAEWASSPRGRLALIILVDQFSRNLFRGDALSFAHDALAQLWCRDGLDRGEDCGLRPIERVFFYLPLEHSESLDDQKQSVELFEALVPGVPEPQRELFEGYADFARQHHAIIERFGRFPHRNVILGRESTADELEFLKHPGSTF